MSTTNEIIKDITETGGHYAITGRYRHPSFTPFIVPKKGKRDVFDVDKIVSMMQSALSFIESCGKKKKVILFVSTRHETMDLIENTARSLSLPFVLNRWIGGTLTNFNNIRGRINHLNALRKDKESGEWGKYTKKEKVLLNRELNKLNNRFHGITAMENLPDALFVLDTRKEKIAVTEAANVGIPVIGFSNADADKGMVQHPIVANIQSRKTVEYVLSLVGKAYMAGALKKDSKSGSDKQVSQNTGSKK